MYTGFTVNYRVNRELTEQEKQEGLAREPQGIEPNDNLSLVQFNSTYIELVGRAFKLRGASPTYLTSIAAVFFICGAVAVFFELNVLTNPGALIIALPISIIACVPPFLFWWFFLRKEFFAYTYYPVRFNRKNRMIYVYRHKALGGLLRVPWDSVYFHVGHGRNVDALRDVRGEVMEGDTIKDAFAAGNFIADNRNIVQLWEFIRQYMDEGPEDLSKKTQIDVSVAPTWKNAYIMSAARSGILNDTLRAIFMPLIGLTTITRYLVMKSCKTPVWPDDIEAACAIDPDDPYRLPEPAYMSEFAGYDPNFEDNMRRLKEKDEERLRRSRGK